MKQAGGGGCVIESAHAALMCAFSRLKDQMEFVIEIIDVQIPNLP